MNFIVSEVTFLRYFIPLIIEGNKRGVKSKVFLSPTPAKYNCPEKWTERIKELSVEYAFETLSISKINTEPGLTFLVEGYGIEHLNDSHHKAILPCTIDFYTLYKNYIDKSDSIIFISKFVAEHYNRVSEKNLYLGSPKYDVAFDKNSIIKRFGLSPDNKNILILGPPTNSRSAQTFPHLNKDKITKLYDNLRQILKGYNFIYKTRGKDPLAKNPYSHNTNYKFEDRFWYPHDAMQLMAVSDVVICFDSASIKEMVMLEKPCINFRITDNMKQLYPLKERAFDFLFQHEHCLDRGLDITTKELEKDITKLLTNKFDYSIAKRSHLSLERNSSGKILDQLL